MKITQRERDDLAALGISVADVEVMATGTYAKQRGGTRIPRQPTEGWMRHELEANGVRALGVPMTTAQLVAALRRLGYEVE